MLMYSVPLYTSLSSLIAPAMVTVSMATRPGLRVAYLANAISLY